MQRARFRCELPACRMQRGYNAEGASCRGGVVLRDVWRQEGFHTTREGVLMSLYVHEYAARWPDKRASTPHVRGY